MSSMRALMSIAIAAAVVGVTVTSAVAAEPQASEQVRKVLLTRNAELRTALAAAWLAPLKQNSAERTRDLAIELYASEARLSALGMHRKMIAAQAAIDEVPYFVVAEKGGVTLDLWPLFAGRSFMIPAELLR